MKICEKLSVQKCFSISSHLNRCPTIGDKKSEYGESSAAVYWSRDTSLVLVERLAVHWVAGRNISSLSGTLFLAEDPHQSRLGNDIARILVQELGSSNLHHTFTFMSTKLSAKVQNFKAENNALENCCARQMEICLFMTSGARARARGRIKAMAMGVRFTERI